MKYRTFRAIVVTAPFLLILVGAYVLSSSKTTIGQPALNGETDQVQTSESSGVVPAMTPAGDNPSGLEVAPVTASQDNPQPDAVNVHSAAQTLTPMKMAQRPMDTEILAAAAANILGDKVKDAIPGRAWKVNLFRDAGKAEVNRLKIDLDRDDKWDEKWSWGPEGIKRQVAPADDENYTQESWYRPDLLAWTATKPGVGATTALAESQDKTGSGVTDGAGAAGNNGANVGGNEPPPDIGTALRDLDKEIMAAATRNISADKVKDAIRGRSWKVNLYKDAGKTEVNRAKVDLDRDDKWDEKWTWESDGILREVAPNDDEIYTEKFHLPAAQNSWQPR